MKNNYLLAFILTLISFNVSAKECDLRLALKTYKPQFAAHFYIEYFKDFKIIHSGDERYILSNLKKIGCEIDSLKIIVPVKRTVMMSTTYLPTLTLLQKEKSLIGFQGKRYIVSPQFKKDNIKEVAMKFNPEDLLGLKADLIMGYDSNLSTPAQKEIFKTLNLPVVLNRDFEESSPLGRAEWIVFIASFYNQEERALQIFNSIKENYIKIRDKNIKLILKKKIIVGEIQGGNWVTCGGKSDLAQLIHDAGGELGLSRNSLETQKISLEELSHNKNNYDVWLTHNLWKSENERLDTLKIDSRYSLINARNIYNNNLILNNDGSNDYWETGMQRPDLLLLDLTTIFYPDAYKNYKLKWYRKI